MDRREHDEIMQRLADVMVQQKTIHATLRTVITNHDENMRELRRALTEMAITLVHVKTLLADVTAHSHLRTPSC
jgi:phage shock protein A